MEITIIILSIVQAMSISLGVGSSTLAILNFFHALKDGVIDVTERSFMGTTYIVLRVSMVLILITTVGLISLGLITTGPTYLTTYVLAQAILTGVLFTNAFLMTKHLMPSTFGPAIQAGSWYALGFIMALVPLGLADFSLLTFAVGYLGLVVFAVVLIKLVTNYQRRQRSAGPVGVEVK